MDNYDGQ